MTTIRRSDFGTFAEYTRAFEAEKQACIDSGRVLATGYQLMLVASGNRVFSRDGYGQWWEIHGDVDAGIRCWLKNFRPNWWDRATREQRTELCNLIGSVINPEPVDHGQGRFL